VLIEALYRCRRHCRQSFGTRLPASSPDCARRFSSRAPFLDERLLQLTGNYGGTPKTCCLPQRPEDRNPENKPFGLCHGWLNHQAVRIWLSRFVLTAELMGVSLVIFSVTFLSIYVSRQCGRVGELPLV